MQNKQKKILSLFLIFLIIITSLFLLLYPKSAKKLGEQKINNQTSRIITQDTLFLREKCEKSVSARKNMQNTLRELNAEYNLGIEIASFKDINLSTLNDQQLLEYQDTEVERMTELRRMIRTIDHAAGQLGMDREHR
jgi:hypothetical protein